MLGRPGPANSAGVLVLTEDRRVRRWPSATWAAVRVGKVAITPPAQPQEPRFSRMWPGPWLRIDPPDRPRPRRGRRAAADDPELAALREQLRAHLCTPARTCLSTRSGCSATCWPRSSAPVRAGPAPHGSLVGPSTGSWRCWAASRCATFALPTRRDPAPGLRRDRPGGGRGHAPRRLARPGRRRAGRLRLQPGLRDPRVRRPSGRDVVAPTAAVEAAWTRSPSSRRRSTPTSRPAGCP